MKITITVSDTDREGNSLSTNGVMIRIAKYIDNAFNIEQIEIVDKKKEYAKYNHTKEVRE